MVPPCDIVHVGICAVSSAARRAPADGGSAKKNAAPTQTEQPGGLQGYARLGVPLSVPEIRRLFWRLVLAMQPRVERILAWSRWRRIHPSSAEYWHYQRRVISEVQL